MHDYFNDGIHNVGTKFGFDFSDIYYIKGFTAPAHIIPLTRMKRNPKIALAVAILALVIIVFVAFLPYLTPESIQVTPQEGFMDSYPSIQFNITGHLYTRNADLPMNYSIIVNGSRFLEEGINPITTDFFGNFKFTTPEVAYTVTPLQTGDTIEMKIIVNETGNMITQDFNMTY